MPSFFVSYNKADKAWAEWIAWILEEEGHSTVIQAWDFRPGGNFVLDMQKATVETDKTLVVLSEDYLNAEFTQPEWATAFADDPRSLQRKIIPIKVRECQPRGLLRPLVYVDLVGLEHETARQKILEALPERLKPTIAPSFPKLKDTLTGQSPPEFPNPIGAKASQIESLSQTQITQSFKSNQNVGIGSTRDLSTANPNIDQGQSCLPMRKILLLAANPGNSTRLRLDEEVRDIREGLKRARHRDDFEIAQRWAVRPRDLQRAMLEETPQIVHFSGHGEGEAGLYFEDKVGNTKLVTGTALASLFKLLAQKSNLECVVLNGCYSRIQAEAIAKYVPYVIGMRQAISDRAAIAFSVGFYDALGNGESVEFAFESGKVAMALDSTGCSEMPMLLSDQATIKPEEMSNKGKSLLSALRPDGARQGYQGNMPFSENLNRSSNRIASSQAKLSIVKAKMFQMQSNSSGGKIELDQKELRGLIKTIFDVEKELLEITKGDF